MNTDKSTAGEARSRPLAESVQAVLDEIIEWQGNNEGLAIEQVCGWREQLERALREDGGLAATERKHSESCREQDARLQREAEILQAGYEAGCRTALRDAAAPVPSSAWQPIATYDHGDGADIGENVLVALDGGLVGEAYFNPKASCGTWWWSGTREGLDTPIYSLVTHWQPLPAPPRGERKDES